MYGEAETRPPLADGKGVRPCSKTLFLLEQSEPGAGPPMGRRGGEHCGPSCGKERSGAAPRGHARDDFSRSLVGRGPRKTTSKGLYKVSAGCCA